LFARQPLQDAFVVKHGLTPKGDHVVTIHLFGIEHAPRLQGVNLKDLTARAGVKESFHTELRKGMRLAKFVKVVSHPA
jgi:hypothetical protein